MAARLPVFLCWGLLSFAWIWAARSLGGPDLPDWPAALAAGLFAWALFTPLPRADR